MATIDSIIANIQASIPSLNNSSLTAIYRKIAEVIASFIDAITSNINTAKTEIDNTLNSKRYGKYQYYIEKAKAFQTGYTLSIDTETYDYYYSTIDTTAQIIKQASFEYIDGELILKVAKLNSDTNVLEKLIDAEKLEFTTYFSKFEVLGLPVTKISEDANVLDGNIRISYFSTSSLSVVVADVLDALSTFRNDYIFNGTFYINDLESYLRENVEGVRNAYISTVTMTNEAGAPISISEYSLLSSGYFDYSVGLLAKFEDTDNYVAV